MFSIFNKKEVVIIKVDHAYPVRNWTSEFDHQCSSEFNALLMAENLRKCFHDFVQHTRQIEYEEGIKKGYEKGFKDGKKGIKKKDYPGKNWFKPFLER